jgi:hypothetical protein
MPSGKKTPKKQDWATGDLPLAKPADDDAPSRAPSKPWLNVRKLGPFAGAYFLLLGLYCGYLWLRANHGSGGDIAQAWERVTFPTTWIVISVIVWGALFAIIWFVFGPRQAEYNRYILEKERRERELRVEEYREVRHKEAEAQRQKDKRRQDEEAEQKRQLEKRAHARKLQKEEYEKKCNVMEEDWSQRGNQMLETLLRPGQDTNPDDGTMKLAKTAVEWVAQRFMIPHGLEYHRPLRDKYIEFHERRKWTKDNFPQLMIIAFMFGATLENLPPPHHYRVHFYKKIGLDQAIAICEAILVWCQANPPETPSGTGDDYEDQKLKCDQFYSLKQKAEKKISRCRTELISEEGLFQDEMKQHRRWEDEMHEQERRRKNQADKGELGDQIETLRRECQERNMSEEETQAHIDHLIREFSAES